MINYKYNDKIQTDVDGTIVQPTIVLCTRSGKKLGVLNNIKELKNNHPLNSASELSFDVYKEVNGIKNELWDSIKNFKFIYLPTVSDDRYKWYEITVNIDEENDTIKHITGVHANEAELGQLMLYQVEINTPDDIARDDYKTITIGGKEYGTVFYYPEYPENSLLHRVLADKAFYYHINHVDDSLKLLQREFSFDGTSVYDALVGTIASEIQCLFVFGQPYEGMEEGEYHRTISVYDLLDYCPDCRERGSYSNGVCTHCGSTNIQHGYGNDTGIFISADNLTDSISFSSNTDQVKNFFRLGTGDDYMTAAVQNCNPNGSIYLSYFSDEMKEDMSSELVEKINAYDALYDSYYKNRAITLPSADINAYNTLVTKYQNHTTEELITLSSTIYGFSQLTNYDYNTVNFRGLLQTTMMPTSPDVADTTAQQQIAKLTTSSMSPIGVESTSAMSLTAADTAVISYAKVYVDTSRYRITTENSSYSNATWSGKIIVTSLTDDTDIANKNLTITFNNNAATFMEQKIKKLIKQRETEDVGDTSILEKTPSQMITYLVNYSLDSLNILDEICTAVLDVLADAGYGKSTGQFATMYTQFYKPYWQKKNAIMAEEKVREGEIKTIQKVINDITNRRNTIVNALDMETFFGDLYSELLLYRRETDYTNSNFISDGLTDSEVIKNAEDFFKRAREEIIKSATLQHTISADLYNLFLIPEFRRVITNSESLLLGRINNTVVQQFLSAFDSGNWLRIKVDDKIYKLRLVDWEIDYDKPENLSVEFSDVIYTGVMRQADKGAKANNEIKKNKRQGVMLSQTKIISNIDEQNIVIDSNGLLGRAKNDFDDGYSPEQIKLINKGIYYTNDNWENVQAALGQFAYHDPEDGQDKTGYGLIAATVVGQLILGDELRIFTDSGNFKIDDNGFTANNGTYTVKIDPEASDKSQIFSIYKTQTPTDKLLFVDTNGDLNVKGKITATSGSFTGDITANTLSAGGKTSASHEHAGLFINSTGNLYAGSSNQTIIYANGNFRFGGANGINFNGTNLTLGSSCSISWNNVTNQPSIPSDSHITTITKNTVTTAYVNALNVKAGSVDAENITGTTISGKTITGANITATSFKAMGSSSDHYITLGDQLYCLHNDAGSDSRMILLADYEQTLSGTKEYFYFELYAKQMRFWYTGESGCTLIYEGSNWCGFDGMIEFDKRVNFNYNIYDKNGNQITGSDRNIKTAISKLNIADSASFIYSLIPSEFKYIEGTSNRYHHGFIAQDVKESMGDNDWGVYIDGNMESQKKPNEIDYLGLRYGEFIADIVATIQYQKEIIDNLESRLSILEYKE